MIKSKFIYDVLDLLLDGDSNGIKAKPQIKYLYESDYEYTESGVFVSFTYHSGIEKYKMQPEGLILDGVIIKSTNPNLEAEAIVFFKKGLVDFLEIWKYDGKEYPKENLKKYELTQMFKESSSRKIKRGPNIF